MPTYTFQKKGSRKKETKIMSIAERDKFLEENPDYIQLILPIGVKENFVASRFTNIPIDTDFKSMLDNMKKANPGSTIDY